MSTVADNGRARGQVKVVGLFGPGDQVGGESLDGVHGTLLVCCPDEAAAIGRLLYQAVDLTPAADRQPLVADDPRVVRLIEVVRARCREAVPEWAPEIRAAIAALEDRT